MFSSSGDSLVYRGKAVADGAVSFLVDHFVTTRVARLTVGKVIHEVFRFEDREHRRRSRKIINGTSYLPDSFDVILAKVRGLVCGEPVI